MARGLKCWIYNLQRLYYLGSKNKGADKLCFFALGKCSFSHEAALIFSEKEVYVEQFKDEMAALYQDYQQYFSYIEPITVSYRCMRTLSEEEIRCIFDDNYGIFLFISS